MDKKTLLETKVVWIGEDKLQHYSFRTYREGEKLHFYRQKFVSDLETKGKLIPLTEMIEVSFEEYTKYKNGETI